MLCAPMRQNWCTAVKPPKYCVVTDVHVPGQLRVVGENGVITDLAVVRKMHISHDPVVVAQTRDAGILRRAAIERAEFANRVAITDLEPGRLTCVFLVLRRFAERHELEYAVVAPDAGMAGDDRMRTDAGAGADLDVLADHRISANFDIFGKLRAGMDNGGGMYHCLSDADQFLSLSIVRSVHISSASVTT
jgi:hypothetical protein